MPTREVVRIRMGKKIRAERIIRAWTQEDLKMALLRMGLKRSVVTVGYWEQGRFAPDLESAVALSALFDISVRRLVTGRK